MPLWPCVCVWLHCKLANYAWITSNKISFVLLFCHRFSLNLFVCIQKLFAFRLQMQFLSLFNKWWNGANIQPPTNNKLSYSDEYILALKSTRSNQNQSDFGENNEIKLWTRSTHTHTHTCSEDLKRLDVRLPLFFTPRAWNARVCVCACTNTKELWNS